MDATFALEVFDKAPYVTVSMTRPNGTPYGLPLSLARTDEKTFYFHGGLMISRKNSIHLLVVPFSLNAPPSDFFPLHKKSRPHC